jgi:hypothetical protein
MQTIVRQFILKKTLVSSQITTDGIPLTGEAYGEIYVKNIIVKTDGTGLDGGTNFEIVCDNDKGGRTLFAETVENLGANVTKDFSTASLVGQPTILENGKKLIAKSTDDDCTGNGTIDIYLVLEKVDTPSHIELV